MPHGTSESDEAHRPASHSSGHHHLDTRSQPRNCWPQPSKHRLHLLWMQETGRSDHVCQCKRPYGLCETPHSTFILMAWSYVQACHRRTSQGMQLNIPPQLSKCWQHLAGQVPLYAIAVETGAQQKQSHVPSCNRSNSGCKTLRGPLTLLDKTCPKAYPTTAPTPLWLAAF